MSFCLFIFRKRKEEIFSICFSVSFACIYMLLYRFFHRLARCLPLFMFTCSLFLSLIKYQYRKSFLLLLIFARFHLQNWNYELQSFSFQIFFRISLVSQCCREANFFLVESALIFSSFFFWGSVDEEKKNIIFCFRSSKQFV